MSRDKYQVVVYGAMRLLDSRPAATGFRSINEVLGHREVLAAIQSYGYVSSVEESRF